MRRHSAPARTGHAIVPAVRNLIFALPLSLAACAPGALTGFYGVPPETQAAYDAAPSCCASPAEFSYAALPASGSVDASLDAECPAYDFATGKSYFLAYRLPEAARPFRVTVRSHFALIKTFVFRPEIATLDAKYNEVRRTGDRGLKYVGGALMPPDFDASLDFPAAMEPRPERFIIVRTNKDLMNWSFIQDKSDSMLSLAGRTAVMENRKRTETQNSGPVAPAGVTIIVEPR